jgi:hypothetical protein
MAKIKKPVKKAQEGAAIDNLRVSKPNYDNFIKNTRRSASIANKVFEQNASKKADSLKKDSSRKLYSAMDLELSHLPGGGHRPRGWDQDKVNLISKELRKASKKDDSLSVVERKKVMDNKKNPKYKSVLKNGGVTKKAKFGGPTCKPGSKRYNLAKTFKSVAKKKK